MNLNKTYIYQHNKRDYNLNCKVKDLLNNEFISGVVDVIGNIMPKFNIKKIEIFDDFNNKISINYEANEIANNKLEDAQRAVGLRN